jgi:hypothetical protein
VTRKPSGPISRIEKGPIGTRRMGKGSSGDFYDELQASRMSNCRSYRYMSDGESTMWRSMTKRRSLQIEYCSSQMCN